MRTMSRIVTADTRTSLPGGRSSSVSKRSSPDRTERQANPSPPTETRSTLASTRRWLLAQDLKIQQELV